MLEDGFIITDEESKKITEGVFASQAPLKLKVFSSKEKKKIVILRRIIREFHRDREYTEKEINEILKNIYGDYAILRRCLVDYGYMDRTRDGSKYWVK